MKKTTLFLGLCASVMTAPVLAAAPGGLGPTAAPGATAPAKGEEVAVFLTNYGRIILKLFPKKAPGHVANLKKLLNQKFFDGIKFHRVIPGFMVQTGDPNSKNDNRLDDGTGGPGYNIKAEFNDIKFDRGILGMARSAHPDSGGSQIFIMVAPGYGLNGQYTAFGQVVEGMTVADKIVNLPRDPRDNPLPQNPAVIKKGYVGKWPVK